MRKQIVPTYAVLLAGGVGARLWPVSREMFPKQLVRFFGNRSLIQETITRLEPVVYLKRLRVVCGELHFNEITKQIEQMGIKAQGKIICEPCGRNTAPAILLAILTILEKETDAVICIFPADHVIKNPGRFNQNVMSAIELARQGYIVTFGIEPHYPETGYGYIEGGRPVAGKAAAIKRFVEKPDRKTAGRYLRTGHFFWNSGMFAFKGSVMVEEFRVHQPEMFSRMNRFLKETPDQRAGIYSEMPNISIDYAIMEKTDKGVVLPSDFGWSDIGSWKSLFDFLSKDKDGNAITGDVLARDTRGCLVMGEGRLVVTNSISDLVVIGTDDSVFVSDLEKSRDVKSIYKHLQQTGRREYRRHTTESYPWGTRASLEEQTGYRLERLDIMPGKICRLNQDNASVKSVIVIDGAAVITLGKTERIVLNKGESKTFQKKVALRIQNTGDEMLRLIEVSLSDNS
ncbi:MAG: mannose-1-phosphate guanylyltransferase/mannose-6-phosphate isomerase [Pseudomonadota bacterium]